MGSKRSFVVYVVTACAALACLVGAAPADGGGRAAVEVRRVSGVVARSETWGPDATIIITGDVLVAAATTLVIAPGTTIQIATSDAANLGVDPNRIEYLIYGTLQVDGPATFTSLSAAPACGDWVGIYFHPGSSGYLSQAVVEYGVHAVEIETLNPISIIASTLRWNCHMPPSGNAWGAGMTIYAGTHTIMNTEIHDNVVQAGGGWAEGGGVQMLPEAGPSLFQDCRIYGNQALNLYGDAAGGGMNVLAADPIVHHTEIDGNVVLASNRAFGGGVCLDNSDAVIRAGSFIHDNEATAQDHSAYGGGVAIGQAMTPAPVAPRIEASRVMSNVVSGPFSYGGGISFYDGSWTMAVIIDNAIGLNQNAGGLAAGGGIGMAPGASADRFEDNLIYENVVMASGGGGCGGGMCLVGDNDVDVTNNLVVYNLVDDPPGTWCGGGGIYAYGPDSRLINNTVAENTALTGGQGGGVYLGDGALLNTIVANNMAGSDGGGVFWVGGTADFNDVWNNVPNNYDTASLPPPNDISADPLFRGYGGLAGRYHLQMSSPCVDAGTGPGPGIPGDDYDDQLRPGGAAWDIGFDEAYPYWNFYLPIVLRNKK